jgi:hypothetical protein
VSTKEKEYDFDIDGFVNYKDSTGTKLKTNIAAKKINLNILEPYLDGVFSQVNGSAHTKLTISSEDENKISIIGDVLVDTGSFKVAFTQCKYQITNQTVRFGKDEIDLGILRLKDTLNNTGAASGKIYHQFFRDFSFDNIRVETSKLLLLNTTKNDNSQFYGNVIGNAVMTLDGPLTDLQMNIDGQPSNLDSSHIYLPTGETSKETSKIDYLEFVQFGSEMDKPILGDKSTNIKVNMNITANPACKVDVILDETTGDIIKGQGNGKLNIKVGSTEPLSIRGRYDISKGEYTFNFQKLVKKPFTLSRGSISWNGDPYLAIIDIDAEYLAKKVDVSSITQTPNIKRKEDITIISSLKGNLMKPVISFEFKLPENSDLNRDFYTSRKLADFKNNENEMFKQVASLLLVNSFLTGDQGFLAGFSSLNIATSTIGGILSGFLTNIFNKQLERATKGIVSINIDINPTVDLQSTAKQLQANMSAGLKFFLSNRLNMMVGGNLDYNNPYLQNSNPLTRDITLEWLLNKDGTVRVVGFSKSNTDIISNQRNRSGVQLSYRKDFDKLSDLFKRRKKVGMVDSANGGK